ILSMQSKAQEEQFLLYHEISEKSNRRWHDLRHTTQIMVDLLEQGNTEVAIEYLKDSFNMPSVEKEEYCHHFAVNSMMCLWAERCRKEDISLEISLRVPQELEIEPMELSALFSNAIENAYDSCLLIPKNRGRFIKVESQYNSKRLAIGVTNSCNDDVKFEEGLPLSSKEGGGIGTRSMIYTVKRFHGAYTFETYDGLFFTRLVLNV
ncbi:MAG: GHKL domain-containing protein, partial [Spirochaetia bacterium]|nr:GHKL domain-containing protein [Spirochaetia bacterium]